MREAHNATPAIPSMGHCFFAFKDNGHERLKAKNFTELINEAQGYRDHDIYRVMGITNSKTDHPPLKPTMSGALRVWVEIDPPDDLTGPDLKEWRVDIYTAAESWRLPPSFKIFSGRGVWLEWTLEEKAKPSEVEAVNRALVRIFKGDPHSVNINRIGRMPFTINQKTGELANVVDGHEDRIYRIEDFPADEPGSGDEVIVDADVEVKPDIHKVWEEYKLHNDTASLIRNGTEDKARFKSRSEMLFHLACELIRKKVPDGIILGLMIDRTNEGFAHLHTFPGGRIKHGLEKNARRQLANAHKEVLKRAQGSPLFDNDNAPPDKPTVLQLSMWWLEGQKQAGEPLAFHNSEWFAYEGARGIYSPREDAWMDRRVLGKYPAMRPRGVSEVLRFGKALSLVEAKHSPPCRLTDFTPCKHSLVVRNGIVDLRDGAMSPHSPDLFAINAVDIYYEDGAPKPVHFLKFLHESVPKEAIAVVQQLFGLALTGDHSREVIPCFIGPRGSGKSTLAVALEAMLGALNVCTPSLTQLGKTFGTQCTIGKLLLICQETEIGSGPNVDRSSILEFLLKTSSGNTQTVGRKNAPDWEGVLACNIFLFGNKLPVFRDGSALNRRLLVIPMSNQVPDAKQDIELGEKIRGEAGAILKWAIAGLRALPPGKFKPLECAADIMETVERSASDMTAFAQDRLVFDEQHEVLKADLYQDYLLWWAEQEMPPATKLSRDRFLKEFLEAFHGKVWTYQPPHKDKTQPRPVRRYKGVGLECQVGVPDGDPELLNQVVGESGEVPF